MFSDCPFKIKEFVQEGHMRKVLPLPVSTCYSFSVILYLNIRFLMLFICSVILLKGDVDVLCGGPPCQGISGLNRFRNRDDPLNDDKNRQLVTFMNIVSYLRPKFVLMENVVDILQFAEGYLGRYALSRLVAMNYQSRLGIMLAGCYGLPQFRMRTFIWGGLTTMVCFNILCHFQFLLQIYF
jgi:DNA (cytosine-5)-methyltransferase 1